MTRLHPLTRGLLLAIATIADPARADDLNKLKSAVTQAGDVNLDGVTDLMIASRCFPYPRFVWVVSGKDGSVIHTLCGVTSGYGIATSMVPVGDVDLDGYPENMVSVYATAGSGVPTAFYGGAPADACSALVFSGRTGTVLFEIPGALYALGASDVDSDGRPDLAVSVIARPGRMRVQLKSGRGRSPQEAEIPSRAKAVRIHSGKDGHLLYQIDAPADPMAEDFGCSFATLGDKDGDGCQDFAVGAVGGIDSGHLYVYSGRSGLLFDAWQGDSGLDGYGWCMASIDDVDEDGRPDLAVGAANRCVEVRSGSDFRLLSRIDAAYRYAICDGFASSLEGVGDLDLDCVSDWVVGANEDAGLWDVGYAWLVSGRTGRVLREIFESDDHGVDVCGAGDVDSDGVPDVALAIESKDFASLNPADRSGRIEQSHKVRLVSGRTWKPIWEVNVWELRSRTIERKEIR